MLYQLLQILTNCFLPYYAPCLFCSWRARGCSTALSHWCLSRLITAPASRKGLINRRFWEFVPNSCKNKIANLFTSILLSPDNCRCVLSNNFKAGCYQSKHEFKSSASSNTEGYSNFFKNVVAIKLLKFSFLKKLAYKGCSLIIYVTFPLLFLPDKIQKIIHFKTLILGVQEYEEHEIRTP